MDAGHRVMIVDDDDDVRDTIAHVLADEGCEVALAANGREALDTLAALSDDALPCIILLDLMMPVMDGHAFRDEQLRIPRIARIPVVLLTAAAGFMKPTFDAADVLAKPVALEDLVKVIGRHC